MAAESTLSATAPWYTKPVSSTWSTRKSYTQWLGFWVSKQISPWTPLRPPGHSWPKYVLSNALLVFRNFIASKALSTADHLILFTWARNLVPFPQMLTMLVSCNCLSSFRLSFSCNCLSSFLFSCSLLSITPCINKFKYQGIDKTVECHMCIITYALHLISTR